MIWNAVFALLLKLASLGFFVFALYQMFSLNDCATATFYMAWSIAAEIDSQHHARKAGFYDKEKEDPEGKAEAW